MNQWSYRRRVVQSSINFICVFFISCIATAAVSAQSYLATHYVSGSTYYNGIDTTKSTFVTDLHNLIFPHTRVTYDNYDETNVTNFASRDTTNGQRVVTCIYSGENYVYTPPFTWAVFSREHTWCQSWMPSKDTSGFTSRPEYSDQHHLFPVNQNKANGIRSNHPLGTVTTVSSSYLECKYGTDVNGKTVFEPRASHKGDAARALLYMAVCYNGVGGYDWTFNHLNNVILPDSLNEAPENVDTLIAWSHRDPPDAWEKARNEYVDSLQGNRNPFIDHPSWVDLIDFNTLTVKTIVPLATEPTNYVTNFTATLTDSVTIRLNWTDAVAGTQSPSGYLLMAKTSNSFSAPIDGSAYTNDSNLADGTAVVNIAYPSSGTYSFSGLNTGTPYYYKLYSYNGSGSARNYKTDGAVPSASATTTGTTGGGHVVLYEIYGGGGNSGAPYTNDFIVLYNPTSSSVSLSGWSVQYASATGTSWSNKTNLVGSIASHGYYLIQESGGSVGTALPIADATGTISMSATAGKAALCNTTTALSGNSSTGSTIVDFVGYGSTANAYEGIGPTPAPSNTTAVVRSSSGIDTDNNSADFIAAAPNPKNSGSTPLPVDLTSFSVTASSSGSMLNWKTATEVNNYGFEVERRTVGETVNALPADRQGKWEKIGFVAGSGTSNIEHTYSYSDANVSSGTYAYRLKQIDNGGTFKYSSEAEVHVGTVAKMLVLTNYPNPFNPATSMEFTVAATGKAMVKVFNLLGQTVATIFNGEVRTGVSTRVTFNASSLPSGVYFARLESGGQVQIRKMVLAK